MPYNKVRVNSLYRFNPVLIDRIHGKHITASVGQIVRVINLHGCPKANTMGHCYIADPVNDQFLGLVHVNSLRRYNPLTDETAEGTK